MQIESREIGHGGDFILTSYYNSEFYKMRFCNGYSLREAKRLFKIYVKKEDSLIFINKSK